MSGPAGASALVGLRRSLGRVQRVPYVNEALVLGAILFAVNLFPGGAPASVYVVGVVGAAPILLNALGILLVYRSNRFINFSQVAIGLFAAVLFDGLVRGRVLLRGLHSVCASCVGKYPGGTALAVNFWISFVLALVAATAIGWLVYNILIRRFTGSPVLVLTIVTVFLAQALGGLHTTVRDGLVPPDLIQRGLVDGQLRPPVNGSVTLAGFAVQLPELLLIAAAIVCVAGVGLYLGRSGTGAAIRASADNPARARTLGVDVGAVSARVWALSGLLAGLVGVLGAFGGAVLSKADGPGFSIGQLVLVLAVVVLARFANLWLAVAGALVLSILQAAVQLSFSTQAPLDAAYVVLIGGLLMLQRERRSRAERDDLSGLEVARETRPIPHELRDLPVVRKYVRGGFAIGGIALIGLPFAVSIAQTSLLTDAFILAIVALSLLVLTGWAGQVSLGQFGFAAIGAWTAGAFGLPYPLALLAAGTVGAFAAILVGLPALKLRGVNLAISTLAFSVSATALFIDSRYFGSLLPAQMSAPEVLAVDLADEKVTYYLTLVFLLLACAVVIGLRRTRTGRVLIAIRANEAAGQSFGISVLRARLTAFSVAGFMAAFAGALLAFHLGGVRAESFLPEASIVVFLYAVIGGLGGLAGPLLGVGFYTLVTFFGSGNPLIQYTASGIGALLLMYMAPGGLAELVYSARDAMLRRVAYRMRIPVPSLMGDKRAGMADDVAPLDEKRTGPPKAGDTLPVRYKPAGQWALDRFGKADATKERVGAS